jgi:UDP-3-O-[3-hydroxymyristoyl] glucosamine N-acyltransferase
MAAVPPIAPTSRQIAEALGLEHRGPDLAITRPAAAASATAGALVFVTSERSDLAEPVLEAAARGPLVAIAGAGMVGSPGLTVLVSQRPRLDFARALHLFFAEPAERGIHPTAVVDASATIGADVSIGPHAVIGPHVVIGSQVTIGPSAVVERRCRIGDRTTVNANTVIGGQGFGFEYDESDVPVRVPHLGAVTIGEDVEIGALVSIARGTLDDTVIADHAKIDDHVFIAHNVRIGRGSFVIAGAEISGSVVLGAGAWIGPQVTIRDQVNVGADAMAGIGAVVTKDVEAGMIVAGNPARVLRARDLDRDR